MIMLRRSLLLAVLLSALSGPSLFAQKIDSTLFENLHWRMIGPFRGGRTVGIAGIPDQPNIFYIGVNNGGVWRTSDYGHTWAPIFDEQSTGSIGALAIAPSDPKILYVGSGEGLQRPDLSVGDGMFKSTDGGKSWQYLGLPDAQQIGAVIVDPRDANRVLVAVLGHPYGANEQRGVFLTTDGGKHWQNVLYKDENTGAIALAFNPKDPDIVYASLWSSRQGPWENGEWEGKTSGLYKSTDRGNTWNHIGDGLPTGEDGLGRIGFAIAPGDPNRMYAMVEAPKLGGVYRSDDAGDHWTRVNAEDRIYGRGSDFAEVKVDPRNKDVIFVANTCTYRSDDGGVNFSAIKGAPGGDDYHTIWINPLHPDIIALASDQGAVVSVNGEKTWSSWYNQPTAQFYHVVTDNEFPYNVYGGQQESGSVGIASRGVDGEITFREWHPVAADEYAYIAPDPLHPNMIYGGKGTRYDKTTGEVQNVGPEALRTGTYRFLRTSPLMFSPVDPTALYLASNVLFKTTSGGETWQIISPDLTRETPEVPSSIGIFRSPELEKQPRRGVIYALGLSPLDGSVIWAGTDDGLVHRTTDGGTHWKNITPAGLTSWSKIAGIDAGHFDSKTAYIAVNRIRLDDMRPHIYRTHDGGEHWDEITGGLPANGPVNAVREDPVRKGLLFAGTERAVYVSFDDGDRWLSLRLNMPATSIRDLVIHKSDIAVGTHGRSFWILDNITPLRQLSDEGESEPRLFEPDTAYRVRWDLNTDTPIPPEEPAGENPPDGAMIDYFLPRAAENVTLEVFDLENKLVRKYSNADPPRKVDEKQLRIPTYWIRPEEKLSAASGIHRFLWDLHYSPPEDLPVSFPMTAVIHNTASQPVGPWVLPGTYQVVLTVDGHRMEKPISVLMDPRVKATREVLQVQYDNSMRCYRSLARLKDLSAQVHGVLERVDDVLPKVGAGWLKDSLTVLDRRLRRVEGGSVPDDIDIVYFAVDEGKSVRETLGGLRTKMVYLMMVFQSADAQPTAVQTKAVGDEETVLRAMMQWWDTVRTRTIAKVDGELERMKLEPLGAH